MKKRTIQVKLLARVEGEGALELRVRGGAVADAKLRIFEPPRFFEALLRGRDYREAPDITARICGICPIAYQISAVQAMEDACGVAVDARIRALRRLIYCGEWIESHALHMFMLHAPDFLGMPDVFALARNDPQILAGALAIKKAGNALIRLLGGREVHPVNMRVGGFYSLPSRAALAEVAAALAAARATLHSMLPWLAALPMPDFEQEYTFVALRHATDYPLAEGRIVSSDGLDITVREFDNHVAEEQVAHSTALHAGIGNRRVYTVGPLARYNLNADRLTPGARAVAEHLGLGPVCRNPFRSIHVRAVETYYALDEALRLIAEYTPPPQPAIDALPRAATGYGCSEAPRGLLYHRYQLDGDGIIRDARIIPPTSQNLRSIERDLRDYAGARLSLPNDELAWQCEQMIRNYDPCISCATHALRLHVVEE